MNEYTNQILDYAQTPPNYGTIENYTHKLKATNPNCGDSLLIYLNEKNGVITQASFVADGCAISKASASMLLETLINTNINNLKKIDKNTILNLLQIEISKSREKCAFLVLDALQKIDKKDAK